MKRSQLSTSQMTNSQLSGSRFSGFGLGNIEIFAGINNLFETNNKAVGGIKLPQQLFYFDTKN